MSGDINFVSIAADRHKIIQRHRASYARTEDI